LGNRLHRDVPAGRSQSALGVKPVAGGVDRAADAIRQGLFEALSGRGLRHRNCRALGRIKPARRERRKGTTRRETVVRVQLLKPKSATSGRYPASKPRKPHFSKIWRSRITPYRAFCCKYIQNIDLIGKLVLPLAHRQKIRAGLLPFKALKRERGSIAPPWQEIQPVGLLLARSRTALRMLHR
jgi:hypothetical protein